MKKLKWFILWLIISILFAVVIHILYHLSSPEWLQSVWTPGEILTYVSTVALGLLAMWQNYKIQEDHENERKHDIAVSNPAQFSFTISQANVFNHDPENTYFHPITTFIFKGYPAVERKEANKSDVLRVSFSIRNIGRCLATNIMLKDEEKNICFDHMNADIVSNDEEKNYILPNETGYFVLDIETSVLEKRKKLTYNLCFENGFGSHYSQKISIISEDEYAIVFKPSVCLMISLD